jgi:hypothetical protein
MRKGNVRRYFYIFFAQYNYLIVLERQQIWLHPVYFCVSKIFLKNFKIFLFFFCFKLIFLIFLDHFDVLILKIILKK